LIPGTACFLPRFGLLHETKVRFRAKLLAPETRRNSVETQETGPITGPTHAETRVQVRSKIILDSKKLPYSFSACIHFFRNLGCIFNGKHMRLLAKDSFKTLS
jgi:hypothetical protein